MNGTDEPEPPRRFSDVVRDQFRERRAGMSPALSPRQRQQRAERQAEREAEQRAAAADERDDRAV
jgi:hypothetical protein